jgi:putative ATP-binding cassette transporter
MKLFLFLLKQSWRTMALASLIGLASGGASVAMVAMVHHAIRGRSEHASLRAGLAFFGLIVIVFVTKLLSQWVMAGLSQGSVSRLRLHLCRKILEVPLRHLEEVGEHRLLAAITNDVSSITTALNAMPMLCVNFAIMACGLVYLGWLQWRLLLGLVVFMIVSISGFLFFLGKARSYLRLAREEQDTLMRHTRSLVHGIKELKLFRRRREAFVDDVLTSADKRVREKQMVGQRIQNATVTTGRLLFFAALGLLLYVWPHVQKEGLTPETVSGYALTIMYLMSPLENILSWLPSMSRARISLQKIKSLQLDLEDSAWIPPPGEVTAHGQWSRLELIGVTHAYRREDEERGFTLGPIDWTIKPGELLFIVGGNGSGKTTLVKLLTGLYLPEQGEIRLDGRKITQSNVEDYRQLFSAVFADVMLFESLLGLEHPELDARAQKYLVQLHLDHKVTVKDGVFSTTDLSKGQRKRLALLVAYLEDRPVYVFDEWAADQDPDFKAVFYTQILPELKARGKGVIVVSHDDHYFKYADRIMTLCEGKIADETWEGAAPHREGFSGTGQPLNNTAGTAGSAQVFPSWQGAGDGERIR